MVFRIPAFDPAWIVAESEDFIVVDKPAGIPCMSPRADVRSDLPFRLERFLSERDGRAPSLGVHQRLDARTSGVLIYAKGPALNPALSHAFQTRSVLKEYAAIVERWPYPDELEMRDALGFSRGRAFVSQAPNAQTKEAFATAKVVARHPSGRVQLQLQLHTGRRHQLRAQLAHRGAKVVGDQRYGAERRRLALFARRLEIEGVGRFERELPAWFYRSFETESPYSLANLSDSLWEAAHRRFGIVDRDTDAFCLIHGASEGVPDLVVDALGQRALMQLYDRADAHREVIADALEAMGFAQVYWRRRARALAEEALALRAPSAPTRGEPSPPDQLAHAREHGLDYPIALDQGLSVGIFLDMREERRRVRERARGKRVLNLFGYTGAFSLAAAAGGAQRVATVDISRPALEVAERALSALPFAGDHQLWRHDAFEALSIMARRGERFDLIIADPPTHATMKVGKKKKQWRSDRDWPALIAACAQVAAEGARLLFCSNDARLSLSAFRAIVLGALASNANFSPAQLQVSPLPIDHPEEGESPLKRIWVTL